MKKNPEIPIIKIPETPNDLAIMRDRLIPDLIKWVALIRDGFKPSSKYCGGSFNLADLIDLVLNGDGVKGVDQYSSDREVAEAVLKIIYQNMIEQVIHQNS